MESQSNIFFFYFFMHGAADMEAGGSRLSRQLAAGVLYLTDMGYRELCRLRRQCGKINNQTVPSISIFPEKELVSETCFVSNKWHLFGWCFFRCICQ